jgi:uncharacterized protein
MKYVDASAILRLILDQPGERVPLSKGENLVSSELAEVEAFRTIDRIRLLGAISDIETATRRKTLIEFLSRLDFLAVNRAVLDRARGSFPVVVRSLDAIHVATAEVIALEANEPLEFWTHDQRQAIAALSRGLEVRGIESLDA